MFRFNDKLLVLLSASIITILAGLKSMALSMEKLVFICYKSLSQYLQHSTYPIRESEYPPPLSRNTSAHVQPLYKSHINPYLYNRSVDNKNVKN